MGHPHVWVTVKSELIFAPDGSVTGVRHAWTFDDMFSTFAIQGLASKIKGEFTREELAPLAEPMSPRSRNMNTSRMPKRTARRWSSSIRRQTTISDKKESVLTLNFMVPLKRPVKAKDFNLEVRAPRLRN